MFGIQISFAATSMHATQVSYWLGGPSSNHDY
jgi:hypothetical protein